MRMKNLLLAVLAMVMLVGCSSEPTKPAETDASKPKGPEQVSGRTAFQKLYVAAHGWARDAQPYRLESQLTADSPDQHGKSAVWRASLASAATQGVRQQRGS